MTLMNVLAAAAASFVFGAFWYMTLSKPWIKAANIKCDENGRPEGGSAVPFALSAVAMLVVAGMMRHIFQMGEIDTIAKGFTSGLGIGLFFISPWVMINNAYGMRPFKLTLIDGGYSTFGCAIMGIVLTAF